MVEELLLSKKKELKELQDQILNILRKKEKEIKNVYEGRKEFKNLNKDLDSKKLFINQEIQKSILQLEKIDKEYKTLYKSKIIKRIFIELFSIIEPIFVNVCSLVKKFYTFEEAKKFQIFCDSMLKSLEVYLKFLPVAIYYEQVDKIEKLSTSTKYCSYIENYEEFNYIKGLYKLTEALADFKYHFSENDLIYICGQIEVLKIFEKQLNCLNNYYVSAGIKRALIENILNFQYFKEVFKYQ